MFDNIKYCTLFSGHGVDKFGLVRCSVDFVLGSHLENW